eukprot:CAMPEP_0195627256 /NCGR_PEP_ID=MMETSP0815-20121206/18816_1 /TAXON_ID=97485 /ORGANISM="Prymnesium parvum, Strain Texoma1" /LENGTH=69 /DNA_ID=CAMNT_0040768441 /DNA_START=115 /DNA_END=324 /DNA_ORIENTATION=-
MQAQDRHPRLPSLDERDQQRSAGHATVLKAQLKLQQLKHRRRATIEALLSEIRAETLKMESEQLVPQSI